jgi:hypothetical protein
LASAAAISVVSCGTVIRSRSTAGTSAFSDIGRRPHSSCGFCRVPTRRRGPLGRFPAPASLSTVRRTPTHHFPVSRAASRADASGPVTGRRCSTWNTSRRKYGACAG